MSIGLRLKYEQFREKVLIWRVDKYVFNFGDISEGLLRENTDIVFSLEK